MRLLALVALAPAMFASTRETVDFDVRLPHEENVEIYSNCAEVELVWNRKSLGTKTLAVDASPRTWRGDWEPGTIQALCRNGGQVASRHELRTASVASKVSLSTDRPLIVSSGDDVAYVTARVVDDHDVAVPSASQSIAFSLSGPGAIAALSHEPFQRTARSAWEGECLAVIRATAGGQSPFRPRRKVWAERRSQLKAARARRSAAAIGAPPANPASDARPPEVELAPLPCAPEFAVAPRPGRSGCQSRD